MSNLRNVFLCLLSVVVLASCMLEKRGRSERSEADIKDGVCDRVTENGWSPECMGLAMFDDGVCEDGDFDFAPECQERAEVEWCGNGNCSPEERGFCWRDCDFGICGDGICSREHGEYPWCRIDCGLAISVCGDGVCELGENIVCGQDCRDGLCGDGACNGSEDTWCEHDCGPICSGDTPVNCGDGCFPNRTDCRSDVFTCGGQDYRCWSVNYYANCCEGTFRQLLERGAFYCPVENRGHPTFEGCATADLCLFRGIPCAN